MFFNGILSCLCKRSINRKLIVSMVESMYEAKFNSTSNTNIIFVMPYCELLIQFLNMLSRRNSHIYFIVNRHEDLPYLARLNSLSNLKFIQQGTALDKLSHVKGAIFISCPEMHTTTLTSGVPHSWNNQDYMFSMFEFMLALKSGSIIGSFSYSDNELKLYSENCHSNYDIRHQLMECFRAIFDCYSTLASESSFKIYTLNFLEKHSFNTLRLNRLRKINYLEGILREIEARSGYQRTVSQEFIKYVSNEKRLILNEVKV